MVDKTNTLSTQQPKNPRFQGGKATRTVEFEADFTAANSDPGDKITLASGLSFADRITGIFPNDGVFPILTGATDTDLGFFTRNENGDLVELDGKVLWDGVSFAAVSFQANMLTFLNPVLIHSKNIGQLLGKGVDQEPAGGVELVMTMNAANTATEKLRLLIDIDGATTDSLLVTGAPFLPSQIPGLRLWLDAADASTITEVGGAVSQWNDKSDKGNNATQGIGISQPTTGIRTINGRNAIDFDGLAHYMDIPFSSSLNPSAFTIYMVCISDVTVGGFRSPITSRDTVTDGRQGYILYKNTGEFWQGWTGNDSVWSMTSQVRTAVVGETVILTYTGINNDQQLFVNGLPAGSSSGGYRPNTASGTRIGAGVSEVIPPQFFFDGPIAECLIYSGVHSAALRKILLPYLGREG